MTNKCSVCGAEEDLSQHQGENGPHRYLIDGAPYIKGLVCHSCDDKERASHAVQ